MESKGIVIRREHGIYEVKVSIAREFGNRFFVSIKVTDAITKEFFVNNKIVLTDEFNMNGQILRTIDNIEQESKEILSRDLDEDTRQYTEILNRELDKGLIDADLILKVLVLQGQEFSEVLLKNLSINFQGQNIKQEELDIHYIR